MDRSQLSTEDLAALIADALIGAGLLNPDDFERATGIIGEEIDDGKANEDTADED